ncbi:alpha/beta hydrolase [Neoasaia chiangmaiensis NBRC 101099]|uniref:AB hydrolase-1 domain-containing protein n=1 Tax=Neoasaia chiangmaiensis TaxID=320497 RepID=A0A1U9KRH5_9PROT|nr:alpha/beta hydrolase [Neoasaia chiangmaiensis]AQS88413.1 hypothetical protein A0U93_11205 [Neoasaia chiangmaiensis]GBR39305.1 alpha/beta hydrolase [Neoasaia chiangmaiensis NBRC 101099]GEN14516.1 esterase [Neoasaia chiangmaiensis]
MHRRHLLTSLAATPLTMGAGAVAQPRPGGKVYVLVHGMYGGGWVWNFVTPKLRALGHQVYTPTLTGIGDRSHLLSREITLDTHIEDVCNLLETEELHDIVLVAHSYGGMVGTGVADRLTSRIDRLIYLDALIPENGESAYDILPAGMADLRRHAVQVAGAGIAFPVPQAADVPLPPGPAKDWLVRHMRPHPAATYETPIRLGRPAGAGLPTAYIAYRHPAIASIEPSRQRAKAKPGWQLAERPVPHDVEATEPDVVVSLLTTYG